LSGIAAIASKTVEMYDLGEILAPEIKTIKK
jgi:hypothetical protein